MLNSLLKECYVGASKTRWLMFVDVGSKSVHKRQVEQKRTKTKMPVPAYLKANWRIYAKCMTG